MEKEADLVKQLKALFKALRIHYYQNIQGPHFGLVRGRPDLEAIYKGVTYYIETKHPKTGGKMSGYQKEQREKIEAAGAPYIKALCIKDVTDVMGIKTLGLF